MGWRNRLYGYDWPLIGIVGMLIIIGMVSIYSVDLSRGVALQFVPRQLIAFGIGMVLFIGASSLHKTRYESSARAVYVFALALLLGVLFFGVSIRGTTGWFRFFGFSFQPAEFAKGALILTLAWWASQQRRQFDHIRFLISSGLLTAGLAGLILLQPDLGSASVLIGMWFLLLFFIGAKRKYLLGLVMTGIICSVAAWFFVFEDYQKDRILVFLQPDNPRFALSSGYNVRQSLIAIGAGQFWGAGLGLGSQSQLHFLPEAQTDFIFAVIGEELGFIGSVLLGSLYFLLLWRLLYLARRAQDDFSAYTILGVALLFFVQMTINLGGATALLPVTGVTLPFVSYGGSSLMMNMFFIALVQSIVQSQAQRA